MCVCSWNVLPLSAPQGWDLAQCLCSLVEQDSLGPSCLSPELRSQAPPAGPSPASAWPPSSPAWLLSSLSAQVGFCPNAHVSWAPSWTGGSLCSLCLSLWVLEGGPALRSFWGSNPGLARRVSLSKACTQVRARNDPRMPAQDRPRVTEGGLSAHPSSAWGLRPLWAPLPAGARAQPLRECVVLDQPTGPCPIGACSDVSWWLRRFAL